MLMGRDSFVVGKVVSIISSRWSSPKFAIIAATTILDAAKRKFLDLDSVEVRSRDRIFMSRPKNAPYCLFYTTKRTFYREILLPDTRDIFCERVGNGKKEREKKKAKGGKKVAPHLLNLFKNLLPIYLLYLYTLFRFEEFLPWIIRSGKFFNFLFRSKEIIDRAIQRIERIFIYTDRIKIKKKRRKKKKRLKRRRGNYRITLILISIKTNFFERLCNLYANYATQAFLLNPSIITVWIILYFMLIP